MTKNNIKHSRKNIRVLALSVGILALIPYGSISAENLIEISPYPKKSYDFHESVSAESSDSKESDLEEKLANKEQVGWNDQLVPESAKGAQAKIDVGSKDNGKKVSSDISDKGNRNKEGKYKKVITKRWHAYEGASLKDVLSKWSEDIGIEFVWNSPDSYRIGKTESFKSSYENAVSSLLDQYNEEPVKPYANLHVDPQDQTKKTLIIKSE